MTSSSPAASSRLVVEQVDHAVQPDGYGVARVVLEHGDQRHLGEARGVLTREGDLRCGADAALAAIAAATGGDLRLTLVGIKAVRAFDDWIVVSSIEARGAERSHRLLGARAAGPDGMVHAAVLSVLDAVNRIVEHHLA